MNRRRWAHIAALAALAGGGAWTVKFLIVAATGAEGVDGIAGVLYVTAVTLLAVGSTWIGTKLAGDRSRLLLAVLIVLSPMAFWLSYMALDSVAVALVEGSGPTWLRDELGILATGLAWLAFGLWALRAAPGPRRPAA